ncbi:MAG TPA: hypothetical protein VFH70_08975 [Acidimicrobiales bacterium]|nr:hypothetical protein [Acidimicrobiales bacterium]
MPTAPKVRWLAGLGALAMLTASCGTTLKTTAGRSNGSSNRLSMPSQGGDNGTGVTGAGAGATPVGASGGSVGGLPGVSGGSGSYVGATGGGTSGGSVATGGGNSGGGGGTGGGGVSSGGGSNGSTSGLVPASAPGVTNQNVYIGIAYSSQSAAGDKAIGAAGAAPTYDERNVANAVINYANSHGGFAGRKLVPLYYDINLTTDTNTQEQSACAYWTQDNKILFMGGGDDILDACGQKAGAIVLGSGSATGATFQKYSHLVDPIGISLDRLGQVTTSGLNKAGYFAGKLGLVTWDDPNYRATITNGYLPALSAIHVTPAQIAYISVPQQIGALGDMSAAVSSAVTKFKSLGIDHVIIQDGPAGVWSGAGLTFEWMNQAKSQGYYPRYGQNAANAPGWSVMPSDEMNKALAIDDSDYDPKYDQGWRPNSSRNLCFQIEANAGYPVNPSNQNDEGIAAGLCDYVFFVQKVINGLSKITADGFVQQAQTLGTGFSSASVYGTKLISGRRDGGDMFRTEEYLSSCSCLQYQGQPYYPD